MDSGTFFFPLAFEFDVACIRVFALSQRSEQHHKTNLKERTRLKDTQHWKDSAARKCKGVYNYDAHALLKQPPNAPANAAPKGVSCWTGFIGLDCADMADDYKDDEGK